MPSKHRIHDPPIRTPRTLLDKVWDAHVVRELEDGRTLLYIDRHLVHEVTSPQAFEGLRLSGRKVRRPDLTFATVDHNVPTSANRHLPIADPLARQQVETLREQRRRIRRAALRLRQRPPGHRARHRSRARPDAAGHDDRVRRQPHQHAWRVRRAGVRHRHERSRARARDAVPGAGQAEGDARQLHRHAEPGRHREGCRAGADGPPRRQRRFGITRSSLPARSSTACRWNSA